MYLRLPHYNNLATDLLLKGACNTIQDESQVKVSINQWHFHVAGIKASGPGSEFLQHPGTGWKHKLSITWILVTTQCESRNNFTQQFYVDVGKYSFVGSHRTKDKRPSKESPSTNFWNLPSSRTRTITNRGLPVSARKGHHQKDAMIDGLWNLWEIQENEKSHTPSVHHPAQGIY